MEEEAVENDPKEEVESLRFVCICCHRTVAKLKEDGWPELHEGTSWTSSGDYGSRVLDGYRTLRLYVCDTCLLLNYKFIHTIEEIPPAALVEPIAGKAHFITGAWDPGYNYTSEEHLRVYRAQDGSFYAAGRLGTDPADKVSDPNTLGHGDTLEGAVRNALQTHAHMIFERDRWRQERPAIFTPSDPTRWAPRGANEETRASYCFGKPGEEIGGGMILRLEAMHDDGYHKTYAVRVRPTSPNSQFDERFKPGMEFQFGPWVGNTYGTGIVQEEAESDKW